MTADRVCTEGKHGAPRSVPPGTTKGRTLVDRIDQLGMEVLVGINEADHSLFALEKTIERAELAGDDVTVAVLDDPSTEPTVEELRDRVESIVADAEMPIDVTEIDGEPGPNLVSMAEQTDVQQLVLGDRSRSPMGKIRLDSIVQYVLFNAQRNVKIVR